MIELQQVESQHPSQWPERLGWIGLGGVVGGLVGAAIFLGLDEYRDIPCPESISFEQCQNLIDERNTVNEAFTIITIISGSVIGLSNARRLEKLEQANAGVEVELGQPNLTVVNSNTEAA